MEILTYVAVAAIAVFLFFWYQESRPQSKINHFERKAASFLSGYQSERFVMYGSEELPEEMLLMRNFYIRLKEQYRHSPSETAKCAEDWMRYIVHKSSDQIKFYLMLDDDRSVSTEEERQNRVDKMRESRAISEEIESRFARQLGAVAQKQLAELRKKQEKAKQEFWGDHEGADTVESER